MARDSWLFSGATQEDENYKTWKYPLVILCSYGPFVDDLMKQITVIPSYKDPFASGVAQLSMFDDNEG